MSARLSSSIATWAELARSLETQSAIMRNAMGPVLSNTAFIDTARQLSDQFAQWQRSFGAQTASLQAALPSAISAVQLNSALVASFQTAAEAHRSNFAGLQAAIEIQERAYRQLVGPSLATARLAAALESFQVQLTPPFASLRTATLGLSLAANNVHEQFARVPAVADLLPPWLFQAPTLEPYLATRALAITEHASWEVLDRERDVEAESVIRVMGDELEARLVAAGQEFLEPYQGAFSALQAQNPDWCRHASASVRELMDKLLARLAPDEDLHSHFPNPTPLQMKDGAFTRRAQLQFIFRGVAVEAYAKMAEKDIDLVLATFYPANDGVHTLVPPLTKKQMWVFWRRIQGCLSTVLQAADY